MVSVIEARGLILNLSLPTSSSAISNFCWSGTAMDSGYANNDSMDVDQPSTSFAASTSRANGHHQAEESQAGPSSRPPSVLGADHEATEAQRAQSIPTSTPNYAVGYVYSVDMMVHFSKAVDGDVHPEQPLRIKHILDTLVKNGLTDQMKSLPIRQVRKNEVMLVHSEEHWEKVLELQHVTPQKVEDTKWYYEQMSLYISEGTTIAALLSCGGVVEAALAVARGEVRKSFAIVRPPGHHAEPDEHMGFCFFNNVAVAARVVQQVTPIRKILIIDWDVHHGECNGTQRAFNDDDSVLYISLHRYEEGTFYPSGPYGSLESCGQGKGLGYSVNVPWPCAGMGDADYLHAFQRVIMPIAMEFAPELVIISAGFDAAAGDSLGECEVTPTGYAHMTHMLSGLANGRVVVALEGGYNLTSISNSALAVTKILLGHAPDELPPMVASEAATETVWMVARQQSKYWKSVVAADCEPREAYEDVSYSVPGRLMVYAFIDRVTDVSYRRFSEILKAHRQHYLYTQYDMMELPLLSDALSSQFSEQIMSTADLLENDTIILFVHEFGNLRVELESSMSCNVQVHNSYLLDMSKLIVQWARVEKYALMDVNLYPKPVEKTVTRSKPDHSAPGNQVLTYLWDNFIQLSNAKRVIILGHGPGCKSAIELLNRRAVGMMKLVKGIVQIVGLQDVPSVPTGGNDDLRPWYKENSLVFAPNLHPMLLAKQGSAQLRRHGQIIPLDETQSVKLLKPAMSAIVEFVKEKLGPTQLDDNGMSVSGSS